MKYKIGNRLEEKQMAEAAVTVKYGVNTLSKVDYVGMTISDIRDETQDVLNIPDDAQARINGITADSGHVVAAGCVVEFVKIAGEKGLSLITPVFALLAA